MIWWIQIEITAQKSLYHLTLQNSKRKSFLTCA